MSDDGAFARPSTLERAFELARSGRFASVADIASQLTREQHSSVQQHLSGHTIRRQLVKMCTESRKAKGAEGSPS